MCDTSLPAGSMLVCRICFTTDSKLYPMTAHNILYSAYEAVTGLSLETEEHPPPFLCGECARRLLLCGRFRSSALRAHLLLELLREHNQMTLESIQAVTEDQSTQNSPLTEQMEHFDLDEALSENPELPGGYGDGLVASIKVERDSIGNLDSIEGTTVVKQAVIEEEHTDTASEWNTEYIGDTGLSVKDKLHTHNCDAELNKLGEAPTVSMFNLDETLLENSDLPEVYVDALLHDDKVADANILDAVDTMEDVIFIEEKDTEDEDIHIASERDASSNNETTLGGVTEELSPADCVHSEAGVNTSGEIQTASTNGIVVDRGGEASGTTGRGAARDTRARTAGDGPTPMEFYACDKCTYTTADKCKLTKHIKTHLKKTRACDFCTKKFRFNNELKTHLLTHTGEKPFLCDICNKIFVFKVSLQRHLLTHTGEKPYLCHVCSKTFTQNSTLQMHLVTQHTSEKPYLCHVCKKGFSRKRLLRVHLSTHTGEKNFSCDICGKAFSKKKYLQVHLQTHTGEKPFLCHICTKAFTRNAPLQRHLTTHSNKSDTESYLCHTCKKSFPSKHQHQIHFLLTHSANKSHLRTHSANKSHLCNICDKGFISKCNLKTHLRTHTGEKPFFCSICPKAFVSNSHLLGHLRTHTGERPHVCNVCFKAFTRKSYLKLHLVIHTGEKLYSCDICNKGFAIKSYLHAHLLRHANKKTYICDVCTKGFHSKASLQIHLKKHKKR